MRATLQPFTRRIAGITNLKFVYDEDTPILQRNIEVFISGEHHDCSHPTHQLLRGGHLGNPQLLARTLRRPRRLRSGSAGLNHEPARIRHHRPGRRRRGSPRRDVPAASAERPVQGHVIQDVIAAHQRRDRPSSPSAGRTDVPPALVFTAKKTCHIMRSR